jgi:hypothetical protein
VGRDISPAEAARLSAEGLVTRCIADVLVCADAWLDVDARAHCLGLLLRREGVDPDDWVAGHETASWVHRGALAPERDRSLTTDPAATPEHVVVLGPRGRSSRYTGVVVHRQAVLEPDEITWSSGIRLTTPARTTADLLRLLPRSAATAELARLHAATSVTADAIDAALRRRRGARGSVGARQVLREWADHAGPQA